jgi:hypothetical protein
MNPSAFAQVGPALPSTGLATIAAMRQGQQDAYAKEDRERQIGLENRALQEHDDAKLLAQGAFDAWKSGDRNAFQTMIGKLAAVDPKSATELMNVFGTVDRTNFFESGLHIYNAARAKDEKTQNAALDKAIDTLGVRPNHPFYQGLKEIRDLPANQREDKLIDTLEIAKSWGAFGGYFQNQEKIDVDRYKANVSASSAITSAARLEFQKAQADITNKLDQDKYDLALRKQERLEKRGVIPAGFMVDPKDPNSYIPVPGTEADQVRKQAKNKMVNSWYGIKEKGKRVIGQLENTIKNVDWTTAGFAGTFLKYWPGSEAKDMQSAIQTIKANIGLDRLKKMRDESVSGASGLGQLAIQELDALQNSIASLEQSQSLEAFESNLKIVLKHYKDFQKEAVKMHEGIQKLDPNDLYEIIPGTAGTGVDFKNATTDDLLNQF